MTLSKTLHRMAEKRGLIIDETTVKDRVGNKVQMLDIFADDGSDAAVFYRIGRDGFHFDCSSAVDTEDWPAWIRDEKHLRGLLNDMSACLVGG